MVEETRSTGSADDLFRLLGGEGLYRTLIEELPAMVYIDEHAEECRTRYVSPQIVDILGYEPHEWRDDPTIWDRCLHPLDRERAWAEWNRAVSEETTFRSEYRIARKDGTYIWVRDETRLARDREGHARFWQGVMVDISDRRAAEEIARESEARYQALVEGIPAVVYEMGPDDERRTLYVSRHVEQILGYTRAEWLQQPDIWMELLHPEDREIQLAAHDLHNETGEPWSREYRLIASDGREVWVRDVASLVRDADGRPHTWQGVMLDITAQKQAESDLRVVNDELEFRVASRTAQLAEANEMMSLEIGERIRVEEELRETQHRFRLLVERLPAVVYVWDVAPDIGIVEHYTSPMIEQLLGFTVQEWLSTHEFWSERVHPHDRQRVMAATMRSEHTGEPFRAEYRLLAKDGHVVWVHDQSTLLSRARDGRPKLFQGFILDISDRKAAEAKAQDAEERYRLLAEEGPVMAFAVRLTHEPELTTSVEYLSPQLFDVLGYGADRWRRDPVAWMEVVHPDDRMQVQASFAAALRDDAPYVDEYRALASDGRVVWLSVQGRAIEHDEAGRPTLYQGILLDVTERREAEDRLRASEELYRGYLEQMPAIPWIESVDPASGATRMTYIGHQSRDWLGWSAEELLAEPDHTFRLVHEDDRERLRAHMRAIDDGLVDEWRITYRVIARDGAIHPVLSHGVPVRDQEGQIRAWYGLAVSLRGLVDEAGHILAPGAEPELRQPASDAGPSDLPTG